MQIHNLVRKTKNRTSAPIGRGGKRGKTSGRGTKGQNARAGNKKRPETRDIIKKLPKLRGRGKNSNTPVEKQPTVIVNLKSIESAFDNGTTISPVTLIEKGFITKSIALRARVKILAKGTITKKLHVEGCALSHSAKDAIVKAGGSIK